MANKIQVKLETPEAVRAEIERTRARMSSTIDELEVALIAKKERMRERVNVAGRIRDQPFRAGGVVFGVGLLLGFLTGGRGEGEESADTRARVWEERARRLLAITQAQEDEIDDLEDDLYDTEDADEDGDRVRTRDRLRSFRDDALDRLSGAGSRTSERLRDRLPF